MDDKMINAYVGYWKINKRVENDSSNHIMYECQCVCGTVRNVRKTQLKNGKSQSCGCNGCLLIKGKRYNRLVAITDGYRKDDGRIYVQVRCDCGNEKEVLKQALDSEATQSCGCLNVEILQSRCGEKNHNYKKELTEEERKANNSRGSNSFYQKYRRNVLKRDKYTCQCCGFTRKNNMRVHHIESWDNNKDLRLIEENAITLCPECHDIQCVNSFHNIYGNGNNTTEQLNEYIKQKQLKLE